MNEAEVAKKTEEFMKHCREVDPMLFWDHVLGAGYWSKQAEIVESVFKHDRVTIKSCHGIGKSFTMARLGITFMCLYQNSKVITTAPTFRQVEHVMWREWRGAVNKALVDIGGRVLKVVHEMGEEWFGMGISSDKDDGFQGIHALDLLMIVDEAAGVEDPILVACDALLTSKNNKLVMVGNPTSGSGKFRESFNSELFHKISISCFDTPNFTYFGIKTVADLLKYSREELRELDLPYPELIKPVWVWERAHEWGEESPIFKSRCLAEFPEEGSDTLIGLQYVEQALNQKYDKEDQDKRKYIWLDEKCIGIDVARFGDDTTVFQAGKQNTEGDIEVIDTQWHQGKDTTQTVGKAIRMFYDLGFNKRTDKFIVDDTGVGGGVTDQLVRMGFNVVAVNFGSGSEDERFDLLKAEMFWHMRTIFRDGKIKIIDKGRTAGEISIVKYEYTIKGLISIISKKMMKKEGLKSPDFVDALALMCFGFTNIDVSSYTEEEKSEEEKEYEDRYDDGEGVVDSVGNLHRENF